MSIFVEIGEDNVPFVRLGEHILRLDLEQLDEMHQKRALDELRETPENVEEAFSRLQQLIKDEAGLNIPYEDKKFLMKFLRPCKFYPDSAFKLMRKFYKFKLKYPHIGINLTPHLVKHVFDSEVFSFLPTRTAEGSRIMVISAGSKWIPKEVSVWDLFRGLMVSIEIAMMEPKTQLGGVHVILDLRGLSLIHICQFTPSTAKMIVDWVQDCTPIRLKGIHIINQSILFNMGYAIFKPFLGEKLKRKLFIHGSNTKSLLEKITPESLPPYFGGTEDVPDCPGPVFSEMLFHYEETFKEFNTYCYSKEKVATTD